MALSPEERAEINRQNAAKSTGPKTDEGKARSRRNAIKHGLRAEALALPNEDAAAVAARSDAWNDHYRPQSPAAQHLVNTCVAATLLSDRCHRYHEAALAKQVRDADLAWEVEREEAVMALVVMLRTDPAAAARRLTRTSHGCRWLIETWERLIAALDDRGGWTGPERDEATRIQGFDPDEKTIKESPEAWLIRLFALMCQEDPPSTAVAWIFQPWHQPDRYRDEYRHDATPLREDSLQALREMAVERLDDLRRVEAILLRDFDEPDRASAADRALILHDGPSARLFLRYHAEARTSFHRAYGSLVKALELDAAAEPPNEAEAAPVPRAEAEAEAEAGSVSPNEADYDAGPGEPEMSDGPTGVESDPETPTPAVSTAPRTAPTARIEGEAVGPPRFRSLETAPSGA